MRKFIAAAAVLLMLSVAPAASPEKQADTNAQLQTAQLQPYTSTDGRFTVQFPGGLPEESSREIPLRGGGTATLHQVWVEFEDDSVAYMVMYNDYPSDYATDSAQQVLAATRDGVANGKKITSDRTIDLKGVPGRAFTVAGSDGWQYTIHQFLAGKRLYQLIVVSGQGHAAANAQQFLRSFRIQ